MRIYLIGMPGSGKTTIGNLLAKKLQYNLIDLDAMIEKESGYFIDDIFNQFGESVFRDYETKMLSLIDSDHVIVACGGGIVEQKRNKELMNGLKIYLDTPLETIKKRLDNSYARPLLKTISLDDLYDKRFLKYQNFADVIISNHDQAEKTIHDIIEMLKEKKYL